MSALERKVWSLRDLAVLEGGCGGDVEKFLRQLAVPPEEMTSREQAAYDVILRYRPARAKLRSDNPEIQAEGRREMLVFAASRFLLASIADHEGDHWGDVSICQQAASGFGVAGNRRRQVGILRTAWTTACALSLSDLESDDAEFVVDALFAGLIENDPEFEEEAMSSEAYWEFLDRLEQRNDPNFAGRALRFASRLDTHEAVELLRRAIGHEASKEDQQADARNYLEQLELKARERESVDTHFGSSDTEEAPSD